MVDEVLNQIEDEIGDQYSDRELSVCYTLSRGVNCDIIHFDHIHC